MAIKKFFSIAYRNLVRNGRRTTLTALAVALGLMVVFAMSSLIDGMVKTMVADGIRISSGHLQIRNANYEVDKGSLLCKDLLQDGEGWVAACHPIHPLGSEPKMDVRSFRLPITGCLMIRSACATRGRARRRRRRAASR